MNPKRPLTVKLEHSQITLLQSLPHPITSGVVIRVLLRYFLDGKLPSEIHDAILEESHRAQRALVEGGSNGGKALAQLNKLKKGAA